MTELEHYRLKIASLAEQKGWSQDQVWLMYSLFKEVGELCQAIEHQKSELEIGLEFADTMHFLIQLVHKKAPSINLDEILDSKIESNKYTKKKTYLHGDFIRK